MVPSQPLDHLRLSFEASDEEASMNPGDAGYVLRLTNPAGAAILSLKLTADMVEQVVLTKASCTISMAPDGTIGADVENTHGIAPMAEIVDLDRLVATSITPQMLEDEPQADALLRNLRRKLMAAVGAVDDALEALSKR